MLAQSRDQSQFVEGRGPQVVDGAADGGHGAAHLVAQPAGQGGQVGVGVVDRTDKRRVQPFGEYLPWRPFFRLLSDYADRAGNFVPGTGAGAVDAAGVLDLPALAELLARHRPVLVSLMLANNETGVIQPVAGTVFDFRKPTPVGERVRTGGDQQILWGKGYDHNWVVSRDVARAPRLMARVEEPKSGRILEVLSDQPGIQFYSGNFLDATVVGKAGKLYRQGDAIVLEPQKFPDTPNRPEFGSVRLDPGQTYRNTILFRFPAPNAR